MLLTVTSGIDIAIRTYAMIRPSVPCNFWIALWCCDDLCFGRFSVSQLNSVYCKNCSHEHVVGDYNGVNRFSKGSHL